MSAVQRPDGRELEQKRFPSRLQRGHPKTQTMQTADCRLQTADRADRADRADCAD